MTDRRHEQNRRTGFQSLPHSRQSLSPTPLRPPQASRAKTVLLVDDDADTRLASRWFLSTFDYEVDCVRSGEEALAFFDPIVHDIVMTDNAMPGITGAELAHIIKLRSPDTPVVMYTGLAPRDTSCVDAVITRPTHLLKVKQTLDSLIAQKAGGEGPRAEQMLLKL